MGAAAAARVAAVASAAMIAQQVAGKATRDALYLSHFKAVTLPPMMGVSAVASLVVALWLARMMTRHTPARVVPVGFGAGAAVLLSIWGLSFIEPRASAVALYLYTAIFSTAMISAFWSLINETFDPHTSRRALTAVATGGALGGLLGGLAAWGLSTFISVPTMLPLLAGANVIAMLCARRVTSPDSPRVSVSALESSGAALFPLRVLGQAPYLQNLAAIVALGAVTQGLLDYVFNVEAAKAYSKGPALLSFFAMFWVAVGALSFVRQAAFGHVVLKRFGLALNLALLPATVLVTGAACLALPNLATTSLLRGGEAIQRNSYVRAAYEMLYTPLSDRTKRATKTVIDVGFDRLGTMVASGIAFAAVWLASPRAETVLLAIAMLCALVTLVRSRPRYLGYVPALEESLRRGVQGGDLPEVTLSAPAPAALRSMHEQVADRIAAVAAPKLTAKEVTQAAVAARKRAAAVARDIADLTSTDVARARRVLSTVNALDRTAVAFVIRRLGDSNVRDLALQALRATPLITGQLADSLADVAIECAVRRQIPRVLSRLANPQSAEALLGGAEDVRFEVRYECGRALIKITKANPSIVIPRDRVLACVKSELKVDQRMWEDQPEPPFDDEEGEPPLIARLLSDKRDRRLEHVFNMLALVVERSHLSLAFKALHSGDARLRGTALEYLEAVLPAEVREAVWPCLGEERPMHRVRDAAEILADLIQSPTDVCIGKAG